MDRINGAGTIDLGGGKRGFREENMGTGTEGTDVTDDYMNALQEEIMKVIEACGLAPNASAWDQLARAVQSQKLNYPVVGGSANAITLTLPLAPLNLAALVGVPIRFLATAANTGAVTLAVNGLAATAARRRGQIAVAANHWLAGDLVEVVYDGVQFQVVSVTAPSADDIVKEALFPYVSAVRASNFSSASGIVTGFSNWSAPVGDPAVVAGFNLSNSLFTVPAGMGGLWYVHGGQQPATGHGMRLYKGGIVSGKPISAVTSPAGFIVHCQVSAMVNLADGETVQLANFANEASINLTDFYFTAVRLGKTS
jgi:hypothetical protein